MPKKLSAPEIRRQTVTYFREIAEVFHATEALDLSVKTVTFAPWTIPTDLDVQFLSRKLVVTYITDQEMWGRKTDPLFPLLLAEMLETHDLHTPLF